MTENNQSNRYTKSKKMRKRGFIYQINGRRVSRQIYWVNRFYDCIKNKIDIFVNVRINQKHAEQIIKLMKIFDYQTPNELFNRLIEDNFKLHDANNPKVRVLLKIWGVETTTELYQKLIDDYYKAIQIKIASSQRSEQIIDQDLLNNKKR